MSWSELTTSPPWLTVIGIGADGLLGLSEVACQLVSTAYTLLGSKRHLQYVTTLISPETECLVWTNLTDVINSIKARRGKKVVVLASGDPMLYGIGATLVHHFSVTEMLILPHLSVFSLAAARLGWPLHEVETLTVHGRPLENLIFYLSRGARLLILSENSETPSRVASLLTEYGFGSSRIIVLEEIGSQRENHIIGYANCWSQQRTADLNTLAVECIPSDGTTELARVPGLPDTVYYREDGQITKSEVRAVTLSALAPKPGTLLWDIGSGSGSIAIEWLRTHPTTTAVAVEKNVERSTNIIKNAKCLGVPRLRVINGDAPVCLMHLLQQPEAIFVGGGIVKPGLLEHCWSVLPAGGRMVVNAVTLESEVRLLNWQSQYGGSLIRLAIARLHPIGKGTLSLWKPLTPVLQYQGEKKRIS